MIEEAWLTPFWKTKQSPWNYPGAIVCCLAYLAVDTVLEKEIREKGHRKAIRRVKISSDVRNEEKQIQP